jgi:hypothetical protein
MTRMRILLMALVAVFATGAITAASACATEVELTLEGGGSATGVAFTSKSVTGAKPLLQSVKSGSKVICTAETERGTVTSPKTASSTVVFTGCESSVSGKKCQSGSTSGEIISTLSSKIGTISTSKKEYGLLYTLAPTTKFECGVTLKAEVKGSAIESILRLEGNKPVSETPFLTWTSTATQSKGVQGILHFAGQGNTLLETSENGGAFEMAGEELEVLQTFARKVEIKTGEVGDDTGFEAEKGWSAEASGGGEFVITEEAKVSCKKETFEGVSPVSGFSTKSDLAPKYSECLLEITKEDTTTKTTANVEAKGCDYEFLNPEEPSKDKFKSEFDISDCTGSGILITDSELEAGKTCEVVIPGQTLGKEDEDTDTKEGAPLESEAKVDATDVSSESNECPEAIEGGKEPHFHHHHTNIIARLIFLLLSFFFF